MSNYDWESGTVVLPSSAVAQVKKTVRDAENKFAKDVLALAKAWHKTAGPKPDALLAFLHKQYESLGPNTRYARIGVMGGHDEKYRRRIGLAAYTVLYTLANPNPFSGPKTSRVPVPTAKHLESFGIRTYTNRDNEFDVTGKHGGTAATITFADREVRWEVYENNRAVSEARGGYVGSVFMQALAQVKWTRGTGGYFVGNDEINRDDNRYDGAANYITGTFGPLGVEAEVRDYVRRGFSRAEALRIVKAS